MELMQHDILPAICRNVAQVKAFWIHILILN